MNTVAQVICNVVDFGMSLVEAVSAPRIFSEGGPVRAEWRILPGAVAGGAGTR